MVGPVVKISEDELPKRPNIHYVGGKTYGELPAYLSGWDVALMPFAMNESTEFISPTKTPEYLAGGKPVVSTPVKDVVRHYGHLQGVKIAATADEFVAACEQALELAHDPSGDWLAEADLMLSATSWDTTQARMAGLVNECLGVRGGAQPAMLVAAE
jgi:UDP-galactopyranose mutase